MVAEGLYDVRKPRNRSATASANAGYLWECHLTDDARASLTAGHGVTGSWLFARAVWGTLCGTDGREGATDASAPWWKATAVSLGAWIFEPFSLTWITPCSIT